MNERTARWLTLSRYLLGWGDGEGRVIIAGSAATTPPIYPCHDLTMEEGCNRCGCEMPPGEIVDHDSKFMDDNDCASLIYLR